MNSSFSRIRRWGLFVLISGVIGVCFPNLMFAAETIDPKALTKTLIVLKVDAAEPLQISTKSIDKPPAIIVEFPRRRVTSSLPENSVVNSGVIKSISATYAESRAIEPKRFLQSIKIVLAASYASSVRSESGRIIVEINHPSSVKSEAVEVGIRGGTIIGALGYRSVSERFRAMQNALAEVTPTPLALKISTQAGSLPSFDSAKSKGVSSLPSAVKGAGILKRVAKPGLRGNANSSSGAWLTLGFALAALTGCLWLFRSGLLRAVSSSSGFRKASVRLPSGMMLIDQLVWRAFERQGYQLVVEKELTQPLIGTLRIISKEGSKAALLCVSNGTFFEKQTVEQFIGVMHASAVSEGFLVASGSFTVPAQRLAKEQNVKLIGREELVELVSIGATSEYAAKQLEQQQARLEEAKETLSQYSKELDTLRRQRNEASWYLGEERAKGAKLDAQISELAQQLHRYETEIKGWEQETSSLRKQWEESQWYLGEARSHVSFLESQLAALQDTIKGLESAKSERDEMDKSLSEERQRKQALEAQLAAIDEKLHGSESERERWQQEAASVRKQWEESQWYLGEGRAQIDCFEKKISELEKNFESVTSREQELQYSLDQATRELKLLKQNWGERRSLVRVSASQASMELHNGSEKPLFSGSPRDLTSSGFGLETDSELPQAPLMHLSLRLPGVSEPILSDVEMIWQSSAGNKSRYLSGYRMRDLPIPQRRAIEQFVEQAHSSNDARAPHDEPL